MERSEHHQRGTEIGLFVLRYGIGGVMVLAGIALLVLVPGTGVDGFAMSAGGGLAVVMLNALFRLGVSGDEERRREEAARNYFDEHGEWPDDPPPERRRWTIPAGAVMPDEDRDESR